MFDNTDQMLTGWGADYAAYSIPVSEGGKGPENAREVLAIEVNHHHGITTHELVEGERVPATVYNLSRTLWHPFIPERAINVTDDNHTWEVELNDRVGHFSQIIFRKNEKSPAFINIFRLPYGTYKDGAGVKWFDEKFRVATVGIMAAEIAHCTAQRAKYRLSASAYKDTIRGRKAAKGDRSCADNYERLNRIIVSRYPQLEYLVRYEDEELVAA